jgi:outer membrane cobalamin receptor
MKTLGGVALVTTSVVCLLIEQTARAAAQEGEQGPPQHGSAAAEVGGAQRLEEVVITARKRMEGIESVPATVQVVDSAQLARAEPGSVCADDSRAWIQSRQSLL